MKATINETDTVVHPLWEGEALSAAWDRDIGKFVIRGESCAERHLAIEKCMHQRLRMAVSIEDSGATQLVWQGYIYHADFQLSASDQMECSLTMLINDWWGILPGFSGFYFC